MGPLELDVPRTIGYFGAIALAVAFEVIEPPVGIFIAAVPFMKLLQQRREPKPARFVGAVLEGASKPVGGDSEAVIRLAPATQSGESQPMGQKEGHPGG
jgi:hypothetical protein